MSYPTRGMDGHRRIILGFCKHEERGGDRRGDVGYQMWPRVGI